MLGQRPGYTREGNRCSILLAALTTLALVTPAHRHHFRHHSECATIHCARHADRAWARHHRPPDRCSNSNPVACITLAAHRYGQPLGDALRVAECESGLDPHNEYAGHLGLYQFLYPGTWDTTPYAGRSVYSARWNAMAAMWMWSVGRRGEWACQ